MATAGFRRQAQAVEGLAEWRRALGEIGGTPLQKNFRDRIKTVADDVAADARQRVPIRTGRARRAVKAGVSGNKAYIQEGGNAAPYARWLDFGGVLKPTGGRKNTISRPVIKGGRYLYPAVAANQDRIRRGAEQAFEDTARQLGLI